MGKTDGRVRIGVVGCGSIAQIMHLPYLRELDDRFQIGALCDVSAGTLHAVGERYGVPPHARYTDYRELCAGDLVDAHAWTRRRHLPAPRRRPGPGRGRWP